jgi:hypothetical protein
MPGVGACSHCTWWRPETAANCISLLYLHVIDNKLDRRDGADNIWDAVSMMVQYGTLSVQE